MEHINEIEKLVELVSGSQIHELTAQVGSRRITITGGVPRRVQRVKPVTNPELFFEDAHAAPADSAGSVNGGATHKVIAPMVGVFHHTTPSVVTGIEVRAGQVIGVIESMKLMNDIRSEENGTVTAVLIEDGRAVEYGQALFEVEPADE